MNILLHHDLRVRELVSVLEIGQSRISRHLKILADAGLLENVREGAWGFYHIPETGPGRRFIEAVRYLFESEAVYDEDIKRARQAVEDRRRRTLHFFDANAPRWELLKGEILGSLDLNQTILGRIPGCSVCVDLGCGTGDLLELMTARADKVIGVDSSPRMLEEARKRFKNAGGSVDIRLGEIEHLPLCDAEADIAVVCLVLQYIADPSAALAEAGRVIKSGGRLLLAEIEKHESLELRDRYGARWLGFSRSEVENRLGLNGFAILEVERHSLDSNLVLNLYNAAKK